ncbi:MAG: SusC/RagA family TonB-linked outer membrane protein [Culturomica sp.]|jgi:TonB-linked SusC/RagA family outer membrane protein|nr:SusC/RagA family TonB-linked outer membrane protein [Culturomica sp.]
MKLNLKNISALILVLAGGSGFVQAQEQELADTVQARDWRATFLGKPVMYLDRGLMGEEAGVFYSGNGTAGNAGLLMLRGVTSVNLGTAPYFIVDGLPVRQIPHISSFSSGLTRTNLAFINPLDVADIRILNNGYDASLYGGKAGNGIIYVNIDKGDLGASSIDLTLRTGFSQNNYSRDMLNATEFRSYLYAMMQNRGIPEADLQNNPLFDARHPKYNHVTNWMEVFKRNGSFSDVHLKMKGGDGDTRYLFSLGYTAENETLDALKDQRFNMRLNLNYRITPKIQITNLFSYNYGNTRFLGGGTDWDVNPIYLALTKAPFMSPYEYTDAGVFTNRLADYDVLNKSNPYLVDKGIQNTGRSNRIDAVIKANWMFLPKTSANLDLVVSYNSFIEKLHRKAFGIVPDHYIRRQNSKRTYSEYVLRGDFWLERNGKPAEWLTYNGKLGFDMETYQERMIYARSVNAATDEIVSVQNGTLTDSVANIRFEHRLMNFYLNGGLALWNKVNVGLNLNMERSSNFGEAGSWELYAGAKVDGTLLKAAGSSVNLYASWGRTGNHDIRGAYYLRMYKPTSYYTYGGVYLGNVENKDLKPEITNNYDLGVRLRGLDNRVELTAGYYYRKTTGMLTQRDFPIEIGLDPQYNNEGNVLNQGLEASLSADLFRRDHFTWNFFANFSTLKNEVKDLDNGEIVRQTDGFMGVAKNGEALGSFYGYKVQGIFRNSAEVDLKRADLTPFEAGDYRMEDVNRDDVINELDRQVIGNPFPDFYGGFGTLLAWKGIRFQALFTYSCGNDVYNLLEQKLNSMTDYSNQSVNVLNRWIDETHPEEARLPRLAYGDPSGNFAASDRWVEDGSYLKLKNLSLQYDLPLRNTTGFLKGINFSFSCTNLFTVTGYKGFDPEIFSDIDPLFRGVDTGANPNPTSYVFGVKFAL